MRVGAARSAPALLAAALAQTAAGAGGTARVRAVGCDLVDIEELCPRLHPRFLARAFAPAEIAGGASRADASRWFAARWAAKEAGYKAVCQVAIAAGRGLDGLATFRDYEVRSLAGTPAPTLALHGAPAALLASLSLRVHLSLTDEAGYAAAFVVIADEERS